MWNQTFSSAEAGANSTMCVQIFMHTTLEIPSFTKSGVRRVSALQGSAPHRCTMSMDTWNSTLVSPAPLYLDVWVCEGDECLLKFCAEQSHHLPAAVANHKQCMGQWQVKSVHQVGYLWSCWKVLDVPLEWWLWWRNRNQRIGWLGFCSRMLQRDDHKCWRLRTGFGPSCCVSFGS